MHVPKPGYLWFCSQCRIPIPPDHVVQARPSTDPYPYQHLKLTSTGFLGLGGFKEEWHVVTEQQHTLPRRKPTECPKCHGTSTRQYAGNPNRKCDTCGHFWSS